MDTQSRTWLPFNPANSLSSDGMVWGPFPGPPSPKAGDVVGYEFERDRLLICDLESIDGDQATLRLWTRDDIGVFTQGNKRLFASVAKLRPVIVAHVDKDTL